MQTHNVTLHTERLLLRPFAEDDVEEALNYRNNEEFARFLPHIPQPFTRADAEHFVATNMAEPWDRYPTFAIELDGRLIGTVNLEVDEKSQTAMLGYAISREQWGLGMTPEAAQAVIAWAFRTFGLTKIWASTDARHHRSRRVMEKLGMQHEGTRPSRHLDRAGLRTDEVIYRLLREEWEPTAVPPSTASN
ncbi:MAG: GNAT family N-acetyltransferase [Dehalococcoidia bacterium]|nr:GNAT family N-acetyltransferase [Dehalococcoidia bacterium]